jgi:hypothetical protein
MMDELHALGRAPFMDRLFQGIEDEPGMRGYADAPTDNLPGISQLFGFSEPLLYDWVRSIRR